MADANHNTPDDQSAENGGTLTADMIAALQEALVAGTLQVSSVLSIQRAQPGDIPRIIGNLLAGRRYLIHIPQFMRYPTWAIAEAAWLALDIDPHIALKQQPLPAVDDATDTEVRKLVSILAEELERLVGPRGTPADFIRAIQNLGIRPDWMTDATVAPPDATLPPAGTPALQAAIREADSAWAATGYKQGHKEIAATKAAEKYACNQSSILRKMKKREKDKKR